jgi:anaerobic ribonucleoside-triphosphate reductase activating protein
MINIASILYNDLANGPNLRTVLFVQGCPHHCKGCHNQHTWSMDRNGQLMIDGLK